MTEPHIPEIYGLKLGPRPAPATLNNLYDEVATLLEYFHQNLIDKNVLVKDSQALKSQLVTRVEEQIRGIGPQNARRITLEAITAGIFGGALDGTLLYQHKYRVVQPNLMGNIKNELKKPVELLWANLDRILEIGQSNWAFSEVNDLQLLSGYGKHENRNSLEEGEQMEKNTRNERSPLLTFILASFKGGYAMGVIDAAITHVGKERPGEPPKS